MIIANVRKDIGTFKFQNTWIRYSHFFEFMGKIKKAINLVFKNINMLLTCDVKNTWNVLLIFHT
jgi:hypothetical protein